MNLSNNPAAWGGLLLGGVALMFLATFWRGNQTGPNDRFNAFSRLFLVLLRISIGWHFLVEGFDKLHTVNWSSEPYLREASGPLAPKFREIAGDSLIARLTLEKDAKVPTALASDWSKADKELYKLKEEQPKLKDEKDKKENAEKRAAAEKSLDDATAKILAGSKLPAPLADDWQRYFDAYVSHYEVSQPASAQKAFDRARAKTLVWLSTAKSMKKPSDYPPDLMVEWDVAKRLEVYGEYQDKVFEIEATLPEQGEKAWPEWKDAKAKAAKWRGELKSELDGHTNGLKKSLYDLLSADKKTEAERLAKDQKSREWVPEKLLQRPIDWNRQLDVADTLVKYGLVVIGGGLIVGCFTRLSALLGAALLLMFFLAMPPMPYLPDSPRAEGHYLYINKNIIEMFALLSLAFLPTGKWAGVDGLLQFLNPFNYRKAAEPAVEKRLAQK